MPREKNSTRAPKGQGSIKKRTVTRNGKTYSSWRARCYIENPDTNLPELHEFNGSTQKEALSKMREAQRQAAEGTHTTRCSQYTLAQWLDEWSKNYLNAVKLRTQESYKSNIKNHLKPSPISKVKLSSLTTIQVQKLYNSLKNEKTGEKLSAKTLKNVHGTLHRALQKAVDLDLIRSNPADKVDLPKVMPPEIKPFDEKEIVKFLKAIEGSEYETIFIITLFLGLREGEACGLTWDEVNFKAGQITVKHQLMKIRGTGGKYELVTTKNSKPRTIQPAKSIMSLLESIKEKQFLTMQENCDIWHNEYGFVFTHADGSHFCPQTVYLKFKSFASSIGRPDARFHDLRHSFAVQSLRNGDDIKTVQDNLGHHTAAFTLQTYAHVTEEMRNDSANRMESFIQLKKLNIG